MPTLIGKRLTYSPESMAGLGASLSFDRWQANLTGRDSGVVWPLAGG